MEVGREGVKERLKFWGKSPRKGGREEKGGEWLWLEGKFWSLKWLLSVWRGGATEGEMGEEEAMWRGEKEEAFQFALPPPSASSCPARLGLWETAWHTAYQQLSRSSLRHYSGEVHCATVLTLPRWCKSVITAKHIAREIIMQRLAFDKSDRNLETQSRDIKITFPARCNVTQLREKSRQSLQNPFSRAAIDVLMKVTYFSWPDKVLCQGTMQKHPPRIINSSIYGEKGRLEQGNKK